MIVIISQEQDVHAQAVLGHLRRSGADAWLLDLAKYPMQSSVALRYSNNGVSKAEYRGPDGLRRFEDCRAVWWRRPQPFGIDPAITDPEHSRFAFTECLETFAGLWRTLDAFWVNEPTRDEIAHKKTYQLRVAERVGLDIPDTLVTNDPAEARAFVDVHGVDKTVYKVFSATRRLWRETRILKREELAQLDLVQAAPVIFQEYIPGVDLRVTIVGDDIFPAAIDVSGGEYPVDFRMNMGQARITPTDLPDDVVAGLKELMSRLGLVYGAVDLRRTPDGRHVFLEVNPAGQWLFVEAKTRQPIAKALADLLASKDTT